VQSSETAQENEVHVLKLLKHPNIIAYHGSFVEKGTLSIVMDYADGANRYSSDN